MDDFDKIVLTPEELRTLKSVRRGRPCFQNIYDSVLIKWSLVKATGKRIDHNQLVSVSITDRGERYLLFLSRKRMDKWLPLIMSGLAIMISLTALLSQLGILQLR